MTRRHGTRLGVLLAAATAAGACNRTQAVRFRLRPTCAETTCSKFNVACATHVRVDYLDAERKNPGTDSPVRLDGTGCRAIAPKSGQTLCTFGEEVGPLPAMPADRPFTTRIQAFSHGPGTADCDPDDLLFEGETTRSLRLSGSVPTIVDVDVASCSRGRCSGVSGTLLDLMTRGVVTEQPGISFGYIDFKTQKYETTTATAEVDMAGRFFLDSDESTVPSSFGCRAYALQWPNHRTLFCRQTTTRLPIVNDFVFTIREGIADSAERLLDEIAERDESGGYVIGRVLSAGMGVAGARISSQPGECVTGVDAIDRVKCLWYPEDGWGGRRGDMLTGRAGVFLAAWRTNPNIGGDFGARIDDDPMRQFVNWPGFFVPGAAFVVTINERPEGTPGDPDAGTD